MGFGGGSFAGSNLSLGQFGFMAEAEGQFGMGDFEDILDEIHDTFSDEGGDEDVSDGVNSILKSHGIDPRHLSQQQINQIKNAVA